MLLLFNEVLKLLTATHQYITKLIANKFELSRNESDILVASSAAPDSWGNFPHHFGKEKDIISHLLLARIYFLKDDDRCFEHLGYALHYIQDRWTLDARARDKHTSWERSIDSIKHASIFDDDELRQHINDLGIPTVDKMAYITLLEKIKIQGLTPESIFQHIENLGITSDIKEQMEDDLNSIISSFRRMKERVSHFKINTLRDFRDRLINGEMIKIIVFLLLDRPSSWSSPVIDINFAYRFSFYAIYFVTLSLNEHIRQKILNIRDNQNHAIPIINRISNFPKSYIEKNWNVYRLGRVCSSINKLRERGKKSYSISDIGHITITKNLLGEKVYKLVFPGFVTIRFKGA